MILGIILWLAKPRSLSSYPIPMHLWASKAVKRYSCEVILRIEKVIHNFFFSILFNSSIQFDSPCTYSSITFMAQYLIFPHWCKALAISSNMSQVCCKVSFFILACYVKHCDCSIILFNYILPNFECKVGFADIIVHSTIKKMLT